jgi:flagellar biogenesis protein FliO
MDRDEEKIKKQRAYEIGFLISLMLLVVLQFLFFYYGLPKITNSFKKTTTTQEVKTNANT